MTRPEYDELQYRLSQKLKKSYNNKETGFDEGILCAKSMLKAIFEKSRENGEIEIKKVNNNKFMVDGNYVIVSNAFGNGVETIYKCNWLGYVFYMKYDVFNVEMIKEEDFKFIPFDIARATMMFILKREESGING